MGKDGVEPGFRGGTPRGEIPAHKIPPRGRQPFVFVFKDERIYEFCFDGTEEDKTVAVGTHGCIKQTEDKELFKVRKAGDCLMGAGSGGDFCNTEGNSNLI